MQRSGERVLRSAFQAASLSLRNCHYARLPAAIWFDSGIFRRDWERLLEDACCAVHANPNQLNGIPQHGAGGLLNKHCVSGTEKDV